jgi:hypothetical protein
MMVLLMALPANAGPEVQANTFTQGAQDLPAIAKIANGYIVVWASDGQDGSGHGIYGQRYTENGAKIGAELHISETTVGHQTRPRVAGLADGGFVVVWRGEAPSGPGSIYAAVFRANGLTRSGEVRLSAARGSRQPTVAALANGGFVVIWDPQVGEPTLADIHGRLYDSLARPVSDEFVVYAQEAFQSWPAVAALADGGFVAVLVDEQKLFGQRFDSSGTRAGGRFYAGATTGGGGSQYSPAPIGLSDGGFVVVWQQLEGTYPNVTTGIRGQRFSPTGARLGAEFEVNAYKPLAQAFPSISAFSDGGFVVAWSSFEQDGSGWGVYGQAFNAAGAKSGSEFRLNITTPGDQRFAVVAADRLGRFLAAWSSPDANGLGIFTRRVVKQIQ